MKKAKILAISSIFALLMCACSDGEAPSKTENGGFEYATPSITYDGAGEDEIDLKGTEKIKHIIDDFPKESATKEEKDAYNLKLTKAIADNDIAMKKVDGTIVDYHKRDYGKLSVENYDKKTTFSLLRDNENKTVHGTFTYAEKSNKKETDGNVVANEPINLTGTYDVGVIEKDGSRKIEKKTSFDANAREQKIDFISYNVSNLQKALTLYSLQDYKQAFVDKVNENIEAVNFTYSNTFNVTKNAEGVVELNLLVTLVNNPTSAEADIIKKTDKFITKISKEGVILQAYHFTEEVCENYRADSEAEITPLSLRKLEENYVFTA